MAVRVLVVLAALAALYGCGKVSSPAEKEVSSAPGKDSKCEKKVSSPAEKKVNSAPGENSNGEKIVFIGGFTTTSAYGFAADNPDKIKMYAINPDGTGLTRLTKSTAPGYGLANSLPNGREATITWFPDGWNIESITYGICSPEGRKKESIGYEVCSPDGKKIAFVREQTTNYGSASPGVSVDTDIYVRNADGTGPTPLTTTPDADELSPAWSPDSNKIAFSDGSDIYVVNADGSNQTNLTSTISEGTELVPVWSPDGTKIAFTSSHTLGDSDIFVVNADGTCLTQLAKSGSVYGGPVFSPDGTKIAFTGAPNSPGQPEDSGAFIINANGTGLTRLRLTYNEAREPIAIITWVGREKLGAGAY